MAIRPIPTNYDDLLDALMIWGRAGLKSNAKVIKSYHPPSLDNVTNVAVPMPATVFKTEKITKPYERSYLLIDELPNASHTGSNVVDFNVNTIPTGPDTNLSHEAPKYGTFYKDSALTQDAGTYQREIVKLKIPTIADRVTKNLKVKPANITDKYDDAKAFYTISPLPLPPPANTTKQPIDTRRPIPKRYELVPTGIPCAIPGTLNCHMEIYDSVDVAQPKLKYRIPENQSYYNPDPTDYADQEYTITEPYTFFNSQSK